MNEKKLKSLRKEIDLIDKKLLKVIIKRSSIVKKIGQLKDLSKGVVDKKRENEVLNRLIKFHKGEYSKGSIIRLWREIFYSSAQLQLKKQNALIPKRGLESIKVYKGGTAKIAGKENIIKLSSNESPFGPSKKAIEAYTRTATMLSRYPELTADSLELSISKKFKINKDQIICGTGSDEVLIFTALAFCSPGDEIIHAIHGFEMYPIITKYAGAESVLASEEDFKISIKSILENIRSSTKIIFIANPNNPTGTYLNKKELFSLIKKVPKNIVVVIDTAYAEFADAQDYDYGFNLVDNFENVLITRTFSKAYSLAGIRLGWGYGSKKLINILKRLRPPFNITPGAIAAGIEALKDKEHLQNVIVHNKKVKGWFISELNNIGLKAYDTQTNFVFVIVPEKNNLNALKVNEFLLSNGIAVRYLESYGLKNAIRITLGTKEELNKTLSTIKKLYKKND